jgi:putative transposase
VQGKEEVIQRVRELRSRMPKLGGVKLYEELRQEIRSLPVPFGRDQFFDLLRDRGLLIRKRRRQVRTTMSRHGFPVYPDLIKGLKITRPGQVWVSDITYWRVEQGFYFIFLVTDACSRKIIGHHVALSMDGAHALAALHMAMRNSNHALDGIVHHSDRGSQYCYTRYVNTLKEQGMLVSMTEDSDPRDNAIAERVNGILKNELLAHHKVQNIAQAKALLQEATRIYNEERPHLSCNMLKPSEAHTLDYSLPRRWRTSNRSVNQYQEEVVVVNPRQE